MHIRLKTGAACRKKAHCTSLSGQPPGHAAWPRLLRALTISLMVAAGLLIVWPMLAQQVSADATEPRGAAAMWAFDRLPYFKPGTSVRQVSSYDRTGGNYDGNGVYLYRNARTGGYVVLDEYGAGTVFRIWATGLRGGDLRMYFDGEMTPRLNIPLDQFFQGTNAPFLFPLVGDDLISSGGYYSYYPFAFRQGLRVEFTSVPRYYHITYHVYNSADGVATYTGTEDLGPALDAWNNPTVDPKDASGNHASATGPFDLAAGQSLNLFEHTGSGSIRSLVINLPQLVPTQFASDRLVSDDGRAHRGKSSFVVRLAPDNAGMVLVRRLDYSVGSQWADVYVDNRLVGRWSNSGFDYVDRWRDSRFVVGSQWTQGKQQVTVQLESPNQTWTEFYYWVYSVDAQKEESLSDELDVGNEQDEVAHTYYIQGQQWRKAQVLSYPPGVTTRLEPATLDVLSRARIQMFWDGETVPSVDAPLGLFFGLGTSGEGLMRGLLVGADPRSHRFYNYHPMPFNTRAHMRLVNDSGTPIQGASVEVQYNDAPYSGLGSRAGYFTAIYSRQSPTLTGRDYVAAEFANARGHVVGLMLDISNCAPSLNILEGDERLFFETSDYDPEIHGTGTEDYFTGGWYFEDRPFSLPQHGCPLLHDLDGRCHITMYRLNVADSYPFERQLKINFEHGAINDTNANYESLTFAYLARERPALVKTDSFSPGLAADRASHGYTTTGSAWDAVLDGTFIGRDDGQSFVRRGMAHAGTSSFTLAILPENAGVRLGRILNHQSGNQRAKIYVDGDLAGTWFTGGVNARHPAAYDYFEIPPQLTAGKDSVRITTEFLSADGSWTEFLYEAECHLYDASVTIGSPVRYRILVPTQPLTQTLNNAQLSSSLDVRLAAVAVQSTGGEGGTVQLNGNTMTAQWQSIPAGVQATVIVTTTVRDVPENQAGVLIGGSAEWMGSLGGGTTVGPYTVPLRSIVVTEPDLGATMTSSSGACLEMGDVVTFTIAFGNYAESNASVAHDVTLTDELPGGLTFGGVLPGTPLPSSVSGTNPTEVAWELPSLDPGVEASYAFTATVTGAPTHGITFTNTAYIAGSSLPGQVEGERGGDDSSGEDPRYFETATAEVFIGGTIGGSVWFDRNANGLCDAGEASLPGVSIVLISDAGTTLRTLTRADGSYAFSCLSLPGQYGAHADLASLRGLTDVTTPTPRMALIDETNPARLDLHHGLRGSGQVGGRVWFDYDGDASIDPDESAVPQALLQLADSFGGQYETSSDTTGHYVFGNLISNGPFTSTVVAASLPAGAQLTTPASFSSVLGPAQPSANDHNYGIQGAGQVAGRICFDSDGNGLCSNDESGVGEADVELSDELGLQVSGDVEDDGTFRFENLLVGRTYTGCRCATCGVRKRDREPTLHLDGR